jgi:hypothetical protein
MLFDIPFLADWNKIGDYRQSQTDRSAERENSKVMLALDRKKRNDNGTGGAAPAGYKRRSANPLLETTGVGGDAGLGGEKTDEK